MESVVGESQNLEAPRVRGNHTTGGRGILMTWLAAALLSIVGSAAYAAQAPSVTVAYSNAPGMVTVAYQHPGNDGVRQFRLEQQGASTVLTSAHLSDSFTVPGLQSDTSYQFRVCAAYDNSDSCSSWAVVRTMASQAAQPSQVAPEVRYVKSTWNTVTVGWGNVGNYKKLLVRVEDELGNSDQRDVRRPVGFAEFTFPGMRSGARYKLLVKGCGDPNYTSCGPWSEGRWVTTSTTNQCVQGFVWREAYPGDLVCVRPEDRDQAAIDNAAAPTRIIPCRPSYVLRGAVRGDKVCVTLSARDLAVSENEMNPERSTFIECARLSVDSTRCPSPAPCKQGFVHRQATPVDYVCAPPEARIRVSQENNAHPQNKDGSTCIDGYVWRVAAPNDLVCVKPEVRDQAARDNAAAAGRVAR